MNASVNCKSYSTAPVCVPPLDGYVGEVHSATTIGYYNSLVYSKHYTHSLVSDMSVMCMNHAVL